MTRRIRWCPARGNLGIPLGPGKPGSENPRVQQLAHKEETRQRRLSYFKTKNTERKEIVDAARALPTTKAIEYEEETRDHTIDLSEPAQEAAGLHCINVDNLGLRLGRDRNHLLDDVVAEVLRHQHGLPVDAPSSGNMARYQCVN